MCFLLDVAQHTESFRMGVRPAAQLIHSLAFAYSDDNAELIVTSEQSRFVEDLEAINTLRDRRGRGRHAWDSDSDSDDDEPAHRRSFNLTLLGNRLTAGDPYQVRSDTRSDLPMGRVCMRRLLQVLADEELNEALRLLAEELRYSVR